MNKAKKIINVIIAAALFIWPSLLTAAEKLYNPLSTIDPNQLFVRIAGGLMMVTGILTLVLVILGGYRILTAAGNSENYQKGKKIISYALIGLIVTLGTYTILATTINVLGGGVSGDYKTTAILFDPLNITNGLAEFYGKRLLGFALSGLGGLTLLILIYGGLLWMTAAGNEEKLGKAKKTLGYGVLGLIIVLGSYSLINSVYQPIYTLFTGGQPTTFTETPAMPPPDKLIPCFRYDNNKNFGAECTMETAKDCRQAKENKQPGKSYSNAASCDEIGACVQDLPGWDYKNRVLGRDCKKELFKYISLTLKDGRCPYDDTSPGEGKKAGGCYPTVRFEKNDYPPPATSGAEVSWACIRKMKSDPTQSNCSETSAKECSAETSTMAAGEWYRGWRCKDVGYCRITLGGLYGCKNGVAESMCTPTLFPSVGYPHRLWGCSYIGGSYELIDGKCYVPQSGLKFVAGKACPPKN